MSVDWHLQPTSYTARLYAPGSSYASRKAWAVSAQIEHLGDRLAYAHAASRIDGEPITRTQWRALAAQLRRDRGVLLLLAERGELYIAIDTLTGKIWPLSMKRPGSETPQKVRPG